MRKKWALARKTAKKLKKCCGKGHHFVTEAGKIKVIINILMDNCRLCIMLKIQTEPNNNKTMKAIKAIFLQHLLL